MLRPIQSLVNPPWPPFPFLILSRREGIGYMMKEEKVHQIFIIKVHQIFITAVAVFLFTVAHDESNLELNGSRIFGSRKLSEGVAQMKFQYPLILPIPAL
jgi:hypothetical protein